jgi:hypothetical protein
MKIIAAAIPAEFDTGKQLFLEYAESLGFSDIPAYRENPFEGTVYLEKQLLDV